MPCPALRTAHWHEDGLSWLTSHRDVGCPTPASHVCVVALGLVGVTAPVASDQTYLKLLDAEASKVEAASTDTVGSGTSAPVSIGDADAEGKLASRERFERLLRQRHVGTYSFYRQLPERSREEEFVDYRNGASMEALREKVVNRYLNP